MLVAFIAITFFTSSPPPEIMLVVFASLACTILVFFLVLWKQEEETVESGGSEEEWTRILAELRTGKKKARKPGTGAEVEESKPTDDPRELIRGVELEGWRVVEEDEVPPEDVIWGRISLSESVTIPDLGFEKGFMKILEKEGRRTAFCILKFSSHERAKAAFAGITEEWRKESKYPVSAGEEAVGVYLESEGVDGVFFRQANLLVLILVGDPRGVSQGDSTQFVQLLKRLPPPREESMKEEIETLLKE